MASNDSYLSSLTISSCVLQPVFSSSTFVYYSTVTNTVNGVIVTAVSDQSTATIYVNGVLTTSGYASTLIGLNVGSNTKRVEE